MLLAAHCFAAFEVNLASQVPALAILLSLFVEYICAKGYGIIAILDAYKHGPPAAKHHIPSSIASIQP